MPDGATLVVEPEVEVTDATTAGGRGESSPLANTDEPLVVEELLVEEISIDGMCGVY